MTATNQIGDRPSYMADADTGFDMEGYVLTPGNDGPETVRKALGADTFVGVNHHSTYDEKDTTIRTGEPVAVHHAEEVNVLCAEGNNYTLGDAVHMSDVTAGVATNAPPVDANGDPTTTRVGTVVEAVDKTGATGPELVVVSITGYV